MQGVTTDVCGLCGDSPAHRTDNLEEYIWQKRKSTACRTTSPIRPCSFAEYRDRMNRSCSHHHQHGPLCGNANLPAGLQGWDMRTGDLSLRGAWTCEGCWESMGGRGAWALSTRTDPIAPNMFASGRRLTALQPGGHALGGEFTTLICGTNRRTGHGESSLREVIAIAAGTAAAAGATFPFEGFRGQPWKSRNVPGAHSPGCGPGRGHHLDVCLTPPVSAAFALHRPGEF